MHTRIPAILASGLVAAAMLPGATASAAALPGARAAADDCRNARVSPAENARAAADATLCLLNRERADHGLRPLRANNALARAARGHSRDMVRRSFFDHTAPGNVTFIDRIRRARYSPKGSWSVAENIAWGSAEQSQPIHIVESWMKSPGHRANILNGSFRVIGLGIAPGVPVDAAAARSQPGGTYTTDFGSR
ncbi:CAP domain-containing protein [Conexibacter sp. CPCC 206217]|uniref:CAP domain-containing protein n=1 Tax=Conexibacter sp. CPCC 206217 TaxID=3064574 RepID=UPI00271A034C|nr:CAP domain-containing protein [Conexibacter sp. CPCC 206217]MDO8211237.1 CAP domain-containing protein [Conexibacter sp. CPCC 206217]